MDTFSTTVLGIAAGLLFLAALFALRLIRETGRTGYAWGFVAAALVLMGFRALAAVAGWDTPLARSPASETVTLLVAVLMLCGIGFLPRILRTLQATASALEDSLQKLQASETVLQESESKFRDLAEKSLVGVYLIQDGRFQYANPRLAEIFGYKTEELLNLGPKDLTFPEDWPLVEENLRKRISGETEAIRYDFRGITRQGRVIHVEVYGSRTVYRGRPAVIGTLLDITERKRVEDERARLSLAVEQAAESILITDLDGTIVYVNPAFERVSGYRREEVIGKNPRILKSGKQNEEFYRSLWSTITRGEVWTGHFVNRRKDGSLYEEDAVISPLRDTTGRVVSYVAVKRDVTHEKQIEKQLQQAQKMEAIGRLAGGIAHDFNNLLTTILGYSDLILNQLSPHDPLHKTVQEIRKAGDRAASLTRQLLAFSRKQMLSPKVLNLNAVVEDMNKMLRRLIGEDVELVTALDPRLGSVKADAAQIEQVIMNLAVNARDAMPHGGRLTIETANVELDESHTRPHGDVRPGRYVLLAVSDTGVGIHPDVLPHIFEPFFTTKEQGKGTGLGLSTVYGIVRQSRGIIRVTSEPGQGTTFRIYLPRVEDTTPSAVSEVSRCVSFRGNETVLVVEDEEPVRTWIRRILRLNGYTVLEAGHGEEALEIVARHPGSVDLLVTDVVMPRMNGRVLAERLLSRYPRVRVLYISGYTDNSVVHDGVLEPGIAFLQKPFTHEALLKKVRRLLDGHRGEERPRDG